MGWLPIIFVYVAIWALSIPGALRRVMLKEVCERCMRGPSAEGCIRYTSPQRHGGFKPRGAIRNRNDGDVAAAIWWAAWWPVRACARVLVAVAVLTGRGVRVATLKATPLTEPELERRIREQQAEIERLTEEVGEDG
jgi:hypothetical protein